ncbi:MAG: twin-arginine translocase subunit TatC [Bacteroidales bacterium]|nr:twin-arginine translocase subunit TatC [Bacteroidales bacterium]
MVKKDPNHEMTFLEHLEELRWHLIRSALAIVVFSALAFLFKEIVFDVIIMGPSQPDFPINSGLCRFGREVLNTNKICINQTPFELQNIQMTGQFLAHIKISLIAGVVAAFPYIFYEIWRFIKPAMYNTEQKVARGAVLVISFLFFLGVAFGYFLIAPLSINFLIHYQVSDIAINNIQLMSYVSLVSSLSLASGVLFELPVVVFFLSRVGLITPEFLKKYRRHAVVVILILSAIITPPDVFSQILVALPIMVLYEISIGISRRINKKNKEKLEQNADS